MSKFETMIREGLAARGARRDLLGPYDYVLETPAGRLRLAVDRMKVTATFEERDVALRHPECFWPTDSPPGAGSGAWNHAFEGYLGRGGKTAAAVDRFFSSIDRLLNPPETA